MNPKRAQARPPDRPAGDGRTCSAQEAAQTLGISLATLYAYVSRGLVRSEAGAGSSRARRYHREDINRLREGRAQRRDPARAAARALDMGAPVLESALTLIAEGRVHYRGRDAMALAGTHTLERIAGLLWLDDASEERAANLFAAAGAAPSMPKSAFNADGYGFAERFQIALALAAARDPQSWDLRPAAVAQTGARILTLLVEVAAGGQQTGVGTIGERLARAWAPKLRGSAQRNVATILNSALVICADHELNVSAFTARCVASASATPWHVVIAGLAALQGEKHGGYTERADALLGDIGKQADTRNIRGALLRHLKEGKALPGFGHPLYPQGDPRATLLLELAASAGKSVGSSVGKSAGKGASAKALELSQQVQRTAASLAVDPPNLDFGLATLRQALDLPPGAGLAIFALGRTVGWIAHAIEQYKLDRLIRPRARYTGMQPIPDEPPNPA